MPLQISFLVLRIDLKVARKNNPATCHFVLEFGNNLGNELFRQTLSCIVTLDDIINSDFFKGEVKTLARKLKSSPQQKDTRWLSEMIKLQHQITAIFQANTKAQILFGD